MLTSLLLTLALGQAQPDGVQVRPRVFRSDGAHRITRLGGDDYAFFEAFPSSGAGTTTPCATAAPTGAKGETLTFTRASNGTCTKTASGGLATTGIANGDLVVLSSNVARVEYDSSGYLGLLVEATRTNSLVRSQEFENASWLVDTSAPTITADAATAPDGTATADRMQVGAGGNSALYQSVGAGTKSATVYVRGVSGSGVTYLINYGALSCTACNFVSTSWTRCTAENLTTSTNFGIGHATFCASTVASDAYVWGAQIEAGAYATSYIPTTSAAVTRVADSSLDLASLALAPPFCMGATITGITGASLASAERGLLQYNNEWGMGSSSNQGRTVRVGVGGVNSGTAVAPSFTSSARYSMSRNAAGTQVTVCTNSTCSAATNLAGATTASGALEIGRADSTFTQTYAEGIISQVKVDLSEERCR